MSKPFVNFAKAFVLFSLSLGIVAPASIAETQQLKSPLNLTTTLKSSMVSQTNFPCKSVNNPSTGLPIIADTIVDRISKPQVLLAGYGLDGCNWAGQWFSQWASSTGAFYTGVLNLDYGTNGISGTYNNGTIEGLYLNGDFSKVQGVWKRTRGDSGGACQYGNFEFYLSASSSTGCQINGWWDYCGTGERWLWTSSQNHESY